MRSIADKSLIVISLETYSVVSRLFDYSQRTSSPKFRHKDIEFEIAREEAQNLILNLHFNNVSYSFSFPNNGWISISEKSDGIQTDRFSMGFFRDDHNFSYSGERDFCLEACENLVNIIKTGFNFK